MIKLIRNSLYAALTSVLLWGSAGHAVDVSKKEELFDYTCAALEVDCTGFEYPDIGYAPLLVQIGAIGYYTNNRPGWIWLDVGFLDPHAHDVYQYGTIVHEMVHYIDYEYLYFDDELFDVCESESRAWRVENAYFTALGKYELANWNWREDYPHCHENLGYVDESD